MVHFLAQKSVKKWSTFWSFFGPVFGPKKFKKTKSSYHNSNHLLNFMIAEKSQISIGRLFYVFLIVRSFQLFPWLTFWSCLDHFGNHFSVLKIHPESTKKLKIWKTENCRYYFKVEKNRSKNSSKSSKTLKNGWFSTKVIGTTLLFWYFSLCFEWTLNWHLSFSRFSEKNQIQGQSLKKVDFSRKTLKNRHDTVKKIFLYLIVGTS